MKMMEQRRMTYQEGRRVHTYIHGVTAYGLGLKQAMNEWAGWIG
jgi:hypothetical protein